MKENSYPQGTTPAFFIAILGIAAGYFALARFSLLLAIPPGYASAIWPPAGLALAAALLWGYRVWFGVWLGSFAASLWTLLNAGSAGLPVSTIVAAVIGTGAAFQAVFGAYLISRFVGCTLTLDRGRDAVIFLLLGGPLSCLVNATISVTCLWIAGTISAHDFWFSWFTWWVGDAIGAMVVTPVLLSLSVRHGEIWKLRRISVALPLYLLFFLIASLYVFVSNKEQQRIETEFKLKAELIASQIREEWNAHLDALYSEDGFFAASAEIDRDKFRVFARYWLARHRSIQALEWIPRVQHAERSGYEEAARRDGYPEFKIAERAQQGQLVERAPQPEYFPVYYVEPYEGNEIALGFDLSSDENRLSALNQASMTGKPVGTSRITLVQEKSGQYGFLVFMPIYDSKTSNPGQQKLREALRGFALGVFRIGDAMRVVVGQAETQVIRIQLTDLTADQREQLLYDSIPATLGGDDSKTSNRNVTSVAPWLTTTLEIAERRWQLSFSPTADYLAEHRSLQAWSVLAGGLIFAACACAFLLVVTGRTARIEVLVRERTDALEIEITERKRAEEALRESEARLKIAMDLAKLVQWEYDVETGMFSFDDQFYALYGTTSQQEGGPLMTAETYARKFIPPEESHVVAEEIAKALATTDPNFTRQVEHRIIRADGEERHIIVRYGVVCGPTGRVVKIRGANQDMTERKQAEAALRESEEMYRTLVSLSPDAILTADVNGLLTFTSPMNLQMFGYSDNDEVLGRSMLSWVAPEDQGKVSANIMHLLTEGTLTDTEYTLIKKDGTRFIGEVSAAVIHSSDGSPMRMIAIIRDVTERKRAEEAVLRAKEDWERTFDAVPDLISILDRDYRIVRVNKAMAARLGVTPAECIGLRCYQAVHKTSEPPSFCPHRQLLEDGIEHTAEFHEERLCGDFLVSVSPLLCPVGELVGSVHVCRDITERKRAENTLRESEERFSRFFRASPIGISITSLSDGQIVDINDAYLDLSGYTRVELVGQDTLRLEIWANPEDRPKWQKTLEEQGRIQGFETRFRKKSGEIRDVLVSAEVIEVAGQQYILSLVYDITERKRAEEQRKKLEEQLVQAQKMESVGRLAGGVAHDFNNMLGVIIGQAELALKICASNDKLQHNLEEILNAGLRSADLTRQLLGFARKQTAAPKILDLNDTISGMLKMLKRLTSEDIDLSWHPGLDLGKVKIDPSQVDQILANLVVNARDAIPGVGAITMKTENVVIDDSDRAETPEFIPGQYVLLTVSDTGDGMSKEIRENIFEPFFTTKEVGKGTGLGLSTVYGIVKQNDGFIYVASELRRGTTFKIYLPRFDAETAQVPSQEAAGNLPTGTETILLVEDDEPILDLSKMILEHLGYTVIAAPAPVQALRIAEEHKEDLHLLITDVVMPEMNGRELAEQLRVVRPNLKCLYVSGYTADVIAHRGILDEGVNFIHKPFGIDELSAKVRQVLDQLE
jgi:PAS domain S-box-containing protein